MRDLADTNGVDPQTVFDHNLAAITEKLNKYPNLNRFDITVSGPQPSGGLCTFKNCSRQTLEEDVRRISFPVNIVWF